MQLTAVPDVEIKTLQSEHRPEANVDRPDPSHHAVPHGSRLDLRADDSLEHGLHRHHGESDHQCGDNGSDPYAFFELIKHDRGP